MLDALSHASKLLVMAIFELRLCDVASACRCSAPFGACAKANDVAEKVSVVASEMIRRRTNVREKMVTFNSPGSDPLRARSRARCAVN
jgi:hypothetical protein